VPKRKRWSGGERIWSRWFRWALTLVVLGSVALSTTACDRGDHPARIGSKAPEFTISDSKESLDLNEFRGRVVVLNFWATWCVPCIDEIPTLVELQRRMPQIAVVSVSADEDDTVYRQFLTAHNVNFVSVRDASYRVPHMYGTVKIPETYVIDRKGVLRRKFVSAQNWTNPEILDYLSKL
jgi:cytochrome c biogenesis protein CcmG/thiol:disulfide interchange protein DsbE